MISSVRTAEERFEGLPDYTFKPNYVETLKGYEGLRAHYLDEGPKEAAHTFLCLHGQPTWSYLYRKMIPVFTSAGHRVIAPDFFGFGKSDKPVDDEIYTWTFHRSFLVSLIDHLQLSNITLVCQDWGGLLGLTLPHQMPEKFSRMIVMNTFLATGELPSQAFADWRTFVAENPEFSISGLLKRSAPFLTDEEARAYDAPYPNSEYRAGARRFPALVMTEPEMEGTNDSLRAREFFQTEWQGESFIACGAADPVLGLPIMNALKNDIQGSSEVMILEEGGHFVQEWGVPIAEAALNYFENVN